MTNLNVVLIGMRGSGKSNVAKLLAQKMHRGFVDIDDLLVEKIKMSIPKMVELYGWDWMRNQEALVVSSTRLLLKKVIATGGGVVERKNNMQTLKLGGVIIYLSALPSTLLARIGDDSNRPSLLRGFIREQEMLDIFEYREPLYQEYADHIVCTDELNVKETVDQIVTLFKEIYR